MILKDSGVKRLAVYVMHDDDGIVDKYIDVFLAGLRSETACLRVVINGNVEAEGEARIREIADEVIVRPNVGYDINGNHGDGKIEAKFHKVDGKVLFDFYPFRQKNSFHVTAGLFIGRGDIVTASFFDDYHYPLDAGVKLVNAGDEPWILEPLGRDPVNQVPGVLDLRLKTNVVKPYIGVGFGRAIPKKRVNVAFDLGVQIHGKPRLEGYVYMDQPDGRQFKWLELESQDLHLFGNKTNKDIDNAFDIMDKVGVWPVLNIRVTGRFF